LFEFLSTTLNLLPIVLDPLKPLPKLLNPFPVLLHPFTVVDTILTLPLAICSALSCWHILELYPYFLQMLHRSVEALFLDILG